LVPNPGDSARAADVQYECKAGALHGLADVLRERSQLDAVLAWASPRTRALVLAPPDEGAWLEGRVFVELQGIITDRFGAAYARRLAREMGMTKPLALMRPALERVLRFFGGSPATLFSRAGGMTASILRGMTLEYRAITPRSGEMKVTFPTSRNLPDATFITVQGSMEMIFDLTGERCGRSGDLEIVPDGKRNSAIIPLSW
jgi:hypothetical protein